MSVKIHNPPPPDEPLLDRLLSAIPPDLASRVALHTEHHRRWTHLAQLCHHWRLPVADITVLVLAMAGQLRLLTLDKFPAMTGVNESLVARAETAVRMVDPKQQLVHGSTHRVKQTHWRRLLFHSSYADAPLVLACLALHLSELRGYVDQLPKAQRRGFLEHSSNVFLPVAELFGLWQIRNELAELSFRLFKPEAVRAIDIALQRSQARRQERFAHVKAMLEGRLQELGIGGKVYEHQSSTYSLYRRVRSGGSLHRLAANLKVDVIVETEDDYNRAGSLLVPSNALSPGGRSRSASWLWQEQLKFNGYRAILLTMQRSLQEREDIPNHIYICTYNMEQINTHGYVAATYWGIPIVSNIPIWWEARNAPQEPAESDNSSAQTIKVFGPSGEWHTVPRESTAIEFAYRVHADIGNHCKRIWLNGEPAEAHAALKPNDVVEIDFDVHHYGPIERWYANSQKQRRPSAMQRAYSQRAVNANKGMQLLKEALERQFQIQRVARPPEHDLDKCVRNVVKTAAWNYVDMNAFYTDLANRQLQRLSEAPSAEEVANLIVTDILSRDIRFAEDPTRPIPGSVKIKLAQCKRKRKSYTVVRDQPIVGRLRTDRLLGSTLTVFPGDCPDAPSGANAIPLVWNNEQQLRLTIYAVDRARLLGKILNELYQLYDNCYLHNLNAQTHLGPHATIEADIIARNGQAAMIEPVLKQMQSSGLISTYQITSMILSEHSTSAIPNPYGITPAHTPMLFKGRTKEIDRILRYTKQHSGLISVVGHNRIGKTSLLRYLADQVLPAEGIAAVFFSTGIAIQNVRGFWRAVALSIDEQTQSGEQASLRGRSRNLRQPQGMFRNSIARARRILGQTKFALVIDEFTKLQESWSAEDVAVILDHLKACIETDPDLTVMIGVHDQAFQNRDTPLHQFLAGSLTMRLNHLDEESARRLILEPPGDLVRYEHSAVQELLRLTGCHPYYLQYLLTFLLNNTVASGQNIITCDDVHRTVCAILGDGAVIFQQYRQHLQNTMALVALSAAETLEHRDLITEHAIAGILETYGVTLEQQQIRQTLPALVRCGVLTHHPSSGYSYSVPLFQQWLIENRSLAETTDDYREGSPCRL
jgi:(p)ppGpp synthase/HD superfamily hydrolase